VNLINKYKESNIEDKNAFLRKIIGVLGFNNTKNFLSGIKK
jgi:hypothetical protein